jgi:hypothetical protein
MADEQVISRREVIAALFAIHDLRRDVASILDILQEEDDEETTEDDT